jgi:hypothetical protein
MTIGSNVAARWLAHRFGREPDGPGEIEAARLGLIDLSGEWSVTEHGESALRQHGWL